MRKITLSVFENKRLVHWDALFPEEHNEELNAWYDADRGDELVEYKERGITTGWGLFIGGSKGEEKNDDKPKR